MPANSTAAFLDPILHLYSSRNAIVVSRADLADFCQNHQQDFLHVICEKLFSVIIQYFHDVPASYIDNHILETIANDLSPVVHPLWMARQGALKTYVMQARNLASSASKMKDGAGRNTCIERCCQELENAHALLGGI